MKITETKIFLRNDSDKKLKAYATITFDDSFVVRDLKVIDGSKGLFIAMPSRKMKVSCSKCNHRNVVGSKHCNQCAATLPINEFTTKEERMQDHRDIAHPITSEAREYIQTEILKAYDEEKDRVVDSPSSIGSTTYGGVDSQYRTPAYQNQERSSRPLVSDPSDPLEARLQSTDL